LGIVAVDGFELLEEIEKPFGFRFGSGKRPAHDVFKLEPSELLFSPECIFDPVGFLLWLTGRPRKIKQLTVGELYDIVVVELHAWPA